MSHLFPPHLSCIRERRQADRTVTTGDKLLLQTQVSWHLGQLRVRLQVFLPRNSASEEAGSGQFAAEEDSGMGHRKLHSTLRKESWSEGDC